MKGVGSDALSDPRVYVIDSTGEFRPSTDALDTLTASTGNGIRALAIVAGKTRTEWSNAIVDGTNPLTPAVIENYDLLALAETGPGADPAELLRVVANIAAVQRIDLLAVDTAIGKLAGVERLPLGRCLSLRTAEHEVADRGQWQEVFVIDSSIVGSVPDSPMSLTLSDSSMLPRPGLARYLMRSRAVRETIKTWLLQGQWGSGENRRPWVDRDVLVLSPALTVMQAATLVRATRCRWVVVASNSPARYPKHIVLTPAEFRELLSPGLGDRTHRLGDLVAATLPARSVDENIGFRDPASNPAPAGNRAATTSRRLLVLKRAAVVGVVPPFEETIGHVARPTGDRHPGWTSPHPSGRVDEYILGPSEGHNLSSGSGSNSEWLSSSTVSRTPDAEGRPDTIPALRTANTQHLLASTESSVVTGREAELRVVVSGSIQSGTSGNLRRATAMVDPETPLMVLVRAFGAIRLCDDTTAYRSISPQRPDQVAALDFAYRGEHSGPGELTVALVQGTTDLVELRLHVDVHGNGAAPPGAPQSAAATATVPSSVDQKTLIRIDRRNSEELVCELRLPEADLAWTSHSARFNTSDVEPSQFIAEFNRLRIARRPGSQYPIDVMKGIGVLLAKLLPGESRALLWEHRDTLNGVELQSTLPEWPWELLSLIGPDGQVPDERAFLAQRGLVRRLPNIRKVERLRIGHGRRFISAPSYPEHADTALRSGPIEAQGLADEFGFVRTSTTIDGLSEFLHTADYDILHFVGHGYTVQDGLMQPLLVLDDSAFRGTEPETGLSPLLIQTGSLGGRHPLVFLNSCASGQLLGTGGFPNAFMAAGAAAFIGTHWEVDDLDASRFAERFYRALLDDRATLSEAIQQARTPRHHDWSPSALAYVAYGDPDARVVS